MPSETKIISTLPSLDDDNYLFPEGKTSDNSTDNTKSKSKKKLKRHHNATSQYDVVTSQPVTKDQILSKRDKLAIIIDGISDIDTTGNVTPVRLSKQELSDVDDFINDRLRKKGVKGRAVSISKLARYALRYMLKVEDDLFLDVLITTLKNKKVKKLKI